MTSIGNILGMGKLPVSIQYIVILLVLVHVLAFSYWLLRISTDKKKIEMRFKEE